jgi:TonB-dependent SusC/RagA subfamily outer membrane receptor
MKRLSIILLLIILHGLAYCQTASKDVFNELKTYSAIHITEKAYLHFDKPYYATGDTIYFKAYVTMGERLDLSKVSGILHVDLIGTDNKISQGIKLQLVNGLGWGDFALPDTLQKGNYRIRAYTQWQLNEGNYFEQTIPIGSVRNQKVTEISTARIKTINDKADIQFFTEGGNLINGVRSKIAFKAIGVNGLGIDAKGIVVDNAGKTVIEFASDHLGMGYFYLEPEAGKTYKANITFADGTQNSVDLPVANSKGIALSINNDSLPKATVKIEANPVYFKENKGKDYTLLIYSGGHATTVTVKLDSMLLHLDILKKRLHTGITRVTLFSQTNEPLAERLIFVQNFDQLNLNLNCDKQVYAAREKVNIKLHAENRADSAVVGHFSVSVIDEDKVPVDENTETTILTNFLLTSDLKGTVEQPNYYFTNVNDEKLKNLDLVMLTHGYREFEWELVMSNNYPPLAWQPEKSLQITGIAKSLFGKPLDKASVALISFKPQFLANTVSDDKGKFLFNNLVFNDSVKFVLQAVNARGKNKTEITYNEEKPLSIANTTTTQPTDNINTILPAGYLENNEKQQEELNKLGLGAGRILKEVKIRSVKEDNKYETQSLAGAGGADQVMHSKDIELIGGQLSTSLNGRLRGIIFSPDGTPFLAGNSAPMLVVIDGAEMMEAPPKKGFSVNYLMAREIETIEVLKYASAAAYGMQGGNGVLVITTKKGGGIDPKDVVSTGILPITVQGYYKAREFYSPKYESSITNNHPDLRSTIYWQPELTTDKDGNASFDYFNADGIGNYRVVIEGIDEKGNIGRQVYRYNVKAYGQTNLNTDEFTKLKAYSSTHITEKTYLHFDKPYYATGDTIYFKAYVTMGERLDLSQLSGILHVDLIGTDNKISKGIKLQLVNGLGWGDFALPDTLPKGSYRIRAYTQWQRNEGNYFEQTIPIGSVHNQKVLESSTARSKALNAKADIQFFAEGGNLIDGIRSKIAFKAIGSNGLGIGAKGVLIDNSGESVVEFASAHLGMGYFYLSPEAGKTYKANITFADGTQNSVDLPVVEAKGIALSINNDSLPKATVKIEANPVYFKENKGKDYTLLIYSCGYATSVAIKLDSTLLHLDILKRRLHTGITRITLFSKTNEPLCERLIFVQNFNQLNLNLRSDKTVYAAREKASIKLNAKTRADSAVTGHFSVSVIDENKVPVDENAETTILTNFLLTSDLKGIVEQPNYYFNSINDEKLKNLDLVMLTHGYRKFEWKQVLTDTYPPLAWQPEKNLQITGVAKSLFGKPLDKASVALICFEPKFLNNTVSDDKGKFQFNNLAFTDSVKFVLQAVNAKGKNTTQLIYNAEKPKPTVSMLLTDSDIPSIYLENNEKQQEELNKLGLGTGRVLKEVKIKAKKEPVITNPRYGMPDKVISGDKILYGGSLSVRLSSLIHFNGPMLIVWNGIEMPRDFNIDEIGTGSIESIEVYTNQYEPGYSGVLSINTAFGLQVKDMIATGILPITVQGYYKAREFYSPKYESNTPIPQPDLRSTIYWQPELTTDKDGHASFDYYNADGKSNYRVVIEGIDDKGNIGRQVYRYRVD